jgi:hypothetical protein
VPSADMRGTVAVADDLEEDDHRERVPERGE